MLQHQLLAARPQPRYRAMLVPEGALQETPIRRCCWLPHWLARRRWLCSCPAPAPTAAGMPAAQGGAALGVPAASAMPGQGMPNGVHAQTSQGVAAATAHHTWAPHDTGGAGSSGVADAHAHADATAAWVLHSIPGTTHAVSGPNLAGSSSSSSRSDRSASEPRAAGRLAAGAGQGVVEGGAAIPNDHLSSADRASLQRAGVLLQALPGVGQQVPATKRPEAQPAAVQPAAAQSMEVQPTAVQPAAVPQVAVQQGTAVQPGTAQHAIAQKLAEQPLTVLEGAKRNKRTHRAAAATAEKRPLTSGFRPSSWEAQQLEQAVARLLHGPGDAEVVKTGTERCTRARAPAAIEFIVHV